MGKKHFTPAPLVNERYDEDLVMMRIRQRVMYDGRLEFVLKGLPDTKKTGRLDRHVLKSIKIHKDPAPLIHRLDNIIKREHFNPFLAIYRQAVGTTQNRDISQGRVTMQNQQLQTTFGLMNIRIYQPQRDYPGQLLPVILYLHGGGFIGSTFNTIINTCRAIADKFQAVVVTFEYSLAPEKKFPAALRDSLAMVDWVYDQASRFYADPEKLAIMGDSSGASIAATTTIFDIEQGKRRIKQQLLLYPITNLSADKPEEIAWSWDKYDIKANKDPIHFVLKTFGMGMHYISQLYAGDYNRKDPLISPIFIDTKTASLMPATMLVTAEYDFLRIECEAYAQKIASQNVPVTLFRYRGLDHGFVDKVGYFSQSEDVLNEMAVRFRQRF